MANLFNHPFHSDYKNFIDELPQENELQRAVHYALNTSGKHLRPIICQLVAKCYGVSEEESFGPALALELLHNYTLVHDDLPIMDNDETRRGQPTVHKKFNPPTALLAGNVLLSFAFSTLNTHGHPNTPMMIEILSQLNNSLCLGQTMDMDNKTNEKHDHEEVNFLKTAVFFGASFQMGLLCAEDEETIEENMEELELLGNSLGMAFQYIDDYLDHKQDRETFDPKLLKEKALFYIDDYRKRIMLLPECEERDLLANLPDLLLERTNA